MLPEQITGMRLPSEGGQPQSILITSSNGTIPAKVQQTIVVRENPNIKQEYFVQDTNTDITITTNNSNMLNNNSVSIPDRSGLPGRPGLRLMTFHRELNLKYF